ncbi:MAG: hypothetical protein GX089_09650 [Fibrobacter sp.]|jgi:hypothetical protein|nr:hypothetical protein [Fibrobacter sp.]HON10533.1 hypothetical protein [Chitinispirillaceae bacterium]
MNFPLYLTLDLCLCVIAVIAAVPLYKRLDKYSRKAAVSTFLLLCVLSAGFQYICFIRVGAWIVNPEVTWLIPYRIAGSPVEEYLFWWSFAIIMLELYLYPGVLKKNRTEGSGSYKTSDKYLHCENAR